MSPEAFGSASRAPVVGIGASAGGLEALQEFFRSIAPDLGAAYVVIMHLAPDRDSELPAILARDTEMPVSQVDDRRPVDLQRNRVYVIAPDRKLELDASSLTATPFEQPRQQRNAIDLFFRSLAAAERDMFAVILSGGGSDGAVGAKAVKEVGGLVLVQEPRQAAHDSMPRAAIATGVADVVAPVQELAGQLTRVLRNHGAMARLMAGDKPATPGSAEDEAALQKVLGLLMRRTGHDFSKYKRNTVLRRLMRRMQIHHRQTIPDYLHYLEQSAEEIQLLFNDLLITVTTFFRDPEAWAALREQVLTPLLERAEQPEQIRCWVPGCATGEEAYTLAMLFHEEMERRQAPHELIIFASDADEQALAMAREGLYPTSISADVSEDRLKRWFHHVGDYYQVVPQLRDRIVFARHSLQRDPPFSRLHLISCRNLLIYLERELQDQVMDVFRYACLNDGYLFLGSAETVSGDCFRTIDKHNRIYRVEPQHAQRRPGLLHLPSIAAPPVPTPIIPAGRDARGAAAEAHRVALEVHAPPSILVDEQWTILHLSETAGRFLAPRGGPASLSLTSALRAELVGEVTIALRHVFQAREPWLSAFVAVRFNGTPRRVAVLAQPHHPTDAENTQALVLFLEAGVAETSTPEAPSHAANERERILLEKLHQAEGREEYLRANHQAAEDDLRASNEELQSLNEEYRSTSEELETSKEELQSINEELQTVNLELKTKLDENVRARDDLENLMTATDIPTLFLDRGLSIKRFTPKLAEIFNVRAHDCGRCVGDITHNLVYPQLEPDIKRVLSDLVPVEREVDARDGRAFIVRLRPYRTGEDRIDGVVLTFVEVTNLKQTQAVVRENEERFRALIDASAQTVWTTDAEGQVVEDSPSWRAFTGQTLEQWLRTGWADAVHQQDRQSVMDAWRQAVQSITPFEQELRLCHAASGSYRWTSVRAVPLRNQDGRVRGWVGMNLDIHERKEAEMSLRETDRRKDEFLAMLGHELRNPLAAICNSVEVIALSRRSNAPAVSEDALQRMLVVIERQSRHMTRLVNDLLDVSRISRNAFQLRREPIDALQGINDALQVMQPQIDAHGLRFEMDVPREPLYVHADPERLMQILENLLRNAIQSTPPGGTVRLVTTRAGPEARITIADTGRGVDPKLLDKLFEPYWRVDHDAQAREGMGLGLTLVKRLVNMHGGSIVARSEGQDAGMEIAFTLPLSDSGQSSDRTPPTEAGEPRRILVVDDQEEVADTFAALLKTLGHQVEVVHSGQAAMDAVAQRCPEIAFLDLAMPDMNGRELARELRHRFPTAELILVALSGYPKDPAAVPDTEFQHHLLKPAGARALTDLFEAIEGAKA